MQALKRRIVLYLVGGLAIVLVGLWLAVANPSRDPIMSEPIKLAESTRLKKHVETLAAILPSRNYLAKGSLEKALLYINERWKEIGLIPEVQTFTADGQRYSNIMVRFGPLSDKDVIVVGAHYDVDGDQNPGADDNASGVAGVIELARLIHQKKLKLKHAVELVAYANEEPPFFGTEGMGSAHHALRLRQKGERVLLMLSLEMIGYFSDEPGSQDYPVSFLRAIYPSRGNFISLVGTPRYWSITRKVKQLFRRCTTVPIHSINAPRFLPGIDLSDHSSYWKYGWPGLMITDTAFYRNKHYHQSTDTPDRLDYDRMARVVDGVYGLLANF